MQHFISSYGYTGVSCVPWIGGLAWAGYAAGANCQCVQRMVNTPGDPVSVGRSEQRRTG
jgi:hypothetical protein